MTLLSLVPWYWRWLAILAAFVACFGYGWVKGVHHEQKNLDEFRAAIDKETAVQLARQAERKRLSDALITEKDAKHDQDLADADAFWSAYAAGVRNNTGGSAQPKPVPVVAKICNDPARDSELSGALERYRQGLRGAHDEYRAGVAPLLGAAEVQTADLVNLQDVWARERVINAGTDAPK